MLTNITTKGKSPYSTVITHGFVLDENGTKISKSLGNVVDPHMLIDGRKTKSTCWDSSETSSRISKSLGNVVDPNMLIDGRKTKSTY